METVRRTRLLATGLLVAVFIAGALAGAAFNAVAREPETTAQTDSASRPANRENELARRGGMMRLEIRLLDSLNLSAEQRQKIDQILSARDREVRNMFDPVRARADTLAKQARVELHAQLTESQRSKLDQMVKERRERWLAEREQRERERNRTPDGRPRTDSAKKPTEK